MVSFRSIYNSSPFLFLARPTPPFYSKFILIKISIRREQGTAKFMTQACHISSFASTLVNTQQLYTTHATWQASLIRKQKKNHKGIKTKKKFTKQAKLPVGIRHLRGEDIEGKDFFLKVKLPVGIRHPNFFGVVIYLSRNATFDVSLEMRVHTTNGMS